MKTIMKRVVLFQTVGIAPASWSRRPSSKEVIGRNKPGRPLTFMFNKLAKP